MEVYIEYVIIDNLIINYILLRLTNFSLKLRAKKILCFLSAALGMVVAIILPFLNLSFISEGNFSVLLLSIKVATGMLMVLIIKKPRSLSVLFATFFLFLTFTFIMGGMCFGLMYLLNLQTTFNGIIMYGFEIPVGVLVLLSVMYLKILFSLIKKVREKNNLHKFCYDVKLTNGHSSVIVSGFLDSGNQISFKNEGVVVINYRAFLKLFPNINYQDIILGNLKSTELKDAQFIDIVNANGRGKMLIFTLEHLEIVDNSSRVITLKNQKVGLAKTNFFGKFDCLLSLEIFN